MKEFIFDDSFPGLLTVLNRALKEKGEVKIWGKNNYKPSLFGFPEWVGKNHEEAMDFKKKLALEFSEPAYRPVFYAFLSEKEDFPNLIFDFLRKLKTNEKVLDHPVKDLEKSVCREKVRMLGLVRFKKVKEGYYYSSISPQYNVIGLLAPHFSSRQGKQEWIIHDMSRQVAIFGAGRDWEIKELTGMNFQTSFEEKIVQLLWQEHFKALPVPGRKNRKRQKSLIPRRYWPHLIEKQ